MTKAKALQSHFAKCYICGRRVQEDKLIMLSHLMTWHAAELATSASFQRLLKQISEGAFQFGSALGRIFRGES